MRGSRTEHEWIHDYLNDRLEQGDRDAFEMRLIEDPRLLDATQAVMALRIGLRELQRPVRSASQGLVAGGSALGAVDQDARLPLRTPMSGQGRPS
jgi:hypothetical protein